MTVEMKKDNRKQQKVEIRRPERERPIRRVVRVPEVMKRHIKRDGKK